MPFTLYKSSAGSGKTYVLVREYLKIALLSPSENFRHILAVTFTNKAAGEMKERIITALKELSSGSNGPLFEELTRELPGVDIKKSSGEVLKKLLHCYADFAVATIDSFIYKIVKAFALQLGIHPEFEVELNTDLVLSTIIDTLISMVGIDRNVTKILIEFALSNIEQDRSWQIENTLFDIGREITGHQERNLLHLGRLTEKDFDSLIVTLRREVAKYRKFMKSQGSRALQLIGASGLSREDFAYGGEGTISLLERLRFARKLADLKTSSRFHKSEWYAKKSDPSIKSRIEDLFSAGLDEIRRGIIDYEEGNYLRASTAGLLLKTVYPLAVLKEIKALLEDYKDENRVVLISEFNSKVSELVERETVPFIYSIAGDRYHHYLIDEFQDTSQGQWINIYPLVEEALSYDYFNMAVGDSKQSIYRWRGGDWEIIEGKIKEIEGAYELNEKALKRNFRSAEEIVKFNNRFFEMAAAELSKDGHSIKIYERSKLEQSVDRVNEGFGYVRVELITSEDESLRERALERMIQIIGSLHESGFQYRDVAVLVRRNVEGSVVADALIRKGIPVISPDSLLLCREPLVTFLISVLKYLSDPHDKISLAHMLYYHILTGIGEGERKGKLENIQENIVQYGRGELDPDKAGGIFKIVLMRKSLLKLTLFDLMQELVRILDLDSPRFSGEVGYLQSFLDIVLDFSTRNRGDLDLFLLYWEKRRESFSLAMSEEKEAVRIMTVHKAKGLEFPIVLIPFANWDLDLKSRSLLWLSPDPPFLEEVKGPFPVNAVKDLEDSLFAAGYAMEREKSIIDNLNLLYVAFTRARERLYLLTFEPAGSRRNVYSLLRSVTGNLEGGTQVSDEAYEFGVSTSKREGKGAGGTITHKDLDKFLSYSWKNRITIRRNSRRLWDESGEGKSEKAHWGIVVHDALARIGSLGEVEKSIEKITRDMIREGILSRRKRSDLKRELLMILNLPEVKEWFEPVWEIKAESTIIMAGENIRPDRVLIKGRRAVVIDYKTGIEAEAHRRQLRKYENALRGMGYEEVSSYLLYIEARKVVRV